MENGNREQGGGSPGPNSLVSCIHRRKIWIQRSAKESLLWSLNFARHTAWHKKAIWYDTGKEEVKFKYLLPLLPPTYTPFYISIKLQLKRKQKNPYQTITPWYLWTSKHIIITIDELDCESSYGMQSWICTPWCCMMYTKQRTVSKEFRPKYRCPGT